MAELDPPDGSLALPRTDKRLLVLAGVLLLVPLVALLWVSSYARETPRLWGFPFFFWYQFLWAFLCAGLTYTAHRLVLAARAPTSSTAPEPPRHRRGDETGHGPQGEDR